MFRRLYFLLPNAKLAQNVVSELTAMKINPNKIHTYAEHNFPTGLLNPATKNQSRNEALQIENIFWNGNLLLFLIFFCICIVSLATQEYILSLLSLVVMIISFMTGNFFVKHIPHTHIENFKHATSHNELLLMVDVADEKASYIENAIHRHHPAAIEGGSSWTLKNVDI